MLEESIHEKHVGVFILKLGATDRDNLVFIILYENRKPVYTFSICLAPLVALASFAFNF